MSDLLLFAFEGKKDAAGAAGLADADQVDDEDSVSSGPITPPAPRLP